MKWSWNEIESDCWNHGTYETREEAIKDARACGKTSFYIGECEIVPLATTLDADTILEILDEQYGGETGCEDYIYDGVKGEYKQWLEERMHKIIQEFHCMAGINPYYFRVISEEFTNVEKEIGK